MKLFSHILLLFALVTNLSCCKKKCQDVTNPSCENYDPCYGKSGLSSDFKIYENLGGVGVEADTVWFNNPINIWAQNKRGLNLKWRIRSQNYSVTATDSLLSINPRFEPIMSVAKFYTVTLIVSKDNGECKDYTTIDSTTKIFYLWPEEHKGDFLPPIKYLPIFGTYAGYKKSKPNELVYVTLHDTVRYIPNLPCNGDAANKVMQLNVIRNLAYNHFSSENVSEGYGGAFYRKGASAIWLNQDPFYPNGPENNCYGSRFLIAYKGIARLNQKNKKQITIDYQYKDTVTYKWVSDFFTGERVN